MTAHADRETWAPYPKDARYSVSTFGRVRREVKVNRWPPGLCSLSVSKRGYYRTCVGGKVVNVHRIVAEAFLDNPRGLSEIAHGNGIKTDNRVGNLRWATRKENSDDIDAHGNRPRGETHPGRVLTESEVLWLRWVLADKRPRQPPFHRDLAAELGVSRECVTRIANNQRRVHATPR